MNINPHTTVKRITGQACPTSGTWQSVGSFVTTITIAKGSKLPDYCGIHVQWILISVG